MKESKTNTEKEILCPFCGSPLPEGASFCPHCTRSIHSRTRQKAPKPLQKKFLHIAALAAALAVVVGGIWLYTRPQTVEGDGGVLYTPIRTAAIRWWWGDLTAPTSRLRSYVRQPRQA